MNNLLELTKFVSDQGELGRQRGQQNNLATLTARAAQGQMPDYQQIAQNGGDPMAFKKQAIESLGQAAQWFSQLPPDQQAQQYPSLAQHATELGFPVPQQFDPAFVPKIANLGTLIANKTGSAGQVQSTKVGANGNYWTVNRSGQWTDSGVKADPKFQALQTANGYDLLDPTLGTTTPLYEGGQPPAGQPAPQAAAPNPMTQGPTLDMTVSDSGQPDPTIAALPPQEQAIAQRFIAAGQPFNVQNGLVVPGYSKGVSAQPTGQRVLPPPKASSDNAPSGYRWSADHTRQEVVPGGPADIPASSNDQQTIDFYAQQSLSGNYAWQTGLARGREGQALIKAVKDRIPKLAAENGYDANDANVIKAQYAALSATLKNRQEYVTSVEQLNGTLNKQAALVESLISKGAANGKSPILNAWIQAGRHATGNSDVDALDTAIRGLAREHQRVLTSPLSNAQLSVAAQQTADDLLSKNQTPEQLLAVINVMRTEAKNGLSQGKTTLQETQDEIRGLGKKQAPAALQGGQDFSHLWGGQ
jgi:hypothetical protein